jgi:hypothetical protein
MSEPLQPDLFKSYARKCALVFAAVVCGTLVMVGTSLAHLSNPHLAIGIILAGAGVNAFLVAGHLMHLVSERKMIYALLGFTVFFFIGLMALTLLAVHDRPGMHLLN